ncbi:MULTISPECIES: toxin-antitoxin system toxin subunit [Corynebacterium]|uniref:toxin-antitoxin system toxin subunit n=1 Tax=Corynebacterium TaxID=1716 RepID=UPI00257BB0DF|nr:MULTISPECIES: toxin-antitoxin system toxin subunit [Corynebacterium]
MTKQTKGLERDLEYEEEAFEPTGDIVDTDAGRQIVIVRDFPQSPRVVWDYITDLRDLELWCGNLLKVADREHVYELHSWDKEDSIEITVVECTAPSFLHILSDYGQGIQREIRVFISSDGHGGSFLEFHHNVESCCNLAGTIGPEWEFKLDRLMIALNGGNVTNVCLENYLPHQQSHYSISN